MACLAITSAWAQQEDWQITDDYHWQIDGLYLKCTEGWNSERVAVVPRGIAYDPKTSHYFVVPSYAGDVTVPAYVTNVEAKMNIVAIQSSFCDCEDLSSVTLSEGLEEIDAAFSGCTKLKEVTIPNSVTKLYSGVFSGCTALEYVTWGAGCRWTSACSSILDGCTSLRHVAVPDGSSFIPTYALRNCVALESVEIPGSVTGMGDNVFEGCTSLTSVTLPAGLTQIESNCFKGCTSLKEINLGHVTRYGSAAFMCCSSLKDVAIAEGTTSLPLACFRECTSLRSVTLPATLTNAGSGSFYESNNIEHVYCWATTPPAITDWTFSHYGTLHVQPGCKSAYEATEYWNKFTIVDDLTTGISALGAASQSQPAYDMQGRKGTGLTHGIVIQGGRKRVVK